MGPQAFASHLAECPCTSLNTQVLLFFDMRTDKEVAYVDLFRKRANARIYEEWSRSSLQGAVTEVESRFIRSCLSTRRNILHLDVATGTARISDRLKAICSLSVGVDTSRVMVELAKTKAKRIVLVLSDGQHLPFQEGVFDLVTVFRLLVHLSGFSRLRLLGECRRVLNKQGVLITDIHSNRLSPKRLLLTLQRNETDWASYFEFVKEIRQAKFDLLKVMPVYTSLLRLLMKTSKSEHVADFLLRLSQTLPKSFGDILVFAARKSAI